MLKWLKAKLAAAKAYWTDEAFDQGYKWAAASLLSGSLNRVSIIDYLEVFDPSDYDRGVLAALNDFNKLLDETPATLPLWGGQP